MPPWKLLQTRRRVHRRKTATALVVGMFVLALSYLVPVADPERLALTAGLPLIMVVSLAAAVGVAVPRALHRFGIDPALATGPFITTSNDILGLLIFFTMATVLYLS